MRFAQSPGPSVNLGSGHIVPHNNLSEHIRPYASQLIIHDFLPITAV